jgi:serine/threonine protein phosphatase PrpC
LEQVLLAYANRRKSRPGQGSRYLHQYGAGTNVGNVRDNNEDSYVCDPDHGLWAVADGMGGLGFGEVASAISAYAVTTFIREGQGVNQAIENAHKAIKSYAQNEAEGTNMGTTIVLLLSSNAIYNIFWVGDSRAYMYRDGGIRQVTTDHSLLQSLIDQGELTQEQAAVDPRKNTVKRTLGVQELDTVRADSISDKWHDGEKLMLCSDGLTEAVTDEQIATIMVGDGSDEELAERLVAASLSNGSRDNITVVIISAPPDSISPDSDTEIPAELACDDTEMRLPNPLESMSVVERVAAREQEETERLATESEPDTTDTTKPSPGSPAKGTRRKRGIPLGYILPVAIILILILVGLFGQETQERAVSPPVIHDNSGQRSAPPRIREFPDVDFRQGGITYKLGMKANLLAAESVQQTLSRHGLYAHVELDPGNAAVPYGIYLGPMSTPEARRAAATLAGLGVGFQERTASY